MVEPAAPAEPPAGSAGKLPRALPHFELAMTLVGLFLLQGLLAGPSRLERMALNLAYLLLMGSAIRSLSSSRFCLWAALMSGGIALAGSVATEWLSSPVLLTVVFGGYLGLFASLLWALAERVFAAGRVDANRLLGAISIYLAAGYAWGFLYALMELWVPGSFAGLAAGEAGPSGQDLVRELIYFSFVTLTTLGYGDITPGASLARDLAVLEAIFGQLYLAVVIARLVGLQMGGTEQRG
jgi:hypothetical protein